MKLRTFKNKKDKLFYFQFKSQSLGKIFLSNPNGLESKIDRNDLLISALRSLSDERLTIFKKTKKGKFFFVLKNRFGKTIIKSKKFKKDEFILLKKEINKGLSKLEKIAWAKPHSKFLDKKSKTTKHSSSNKSKNQILKKDRKPKAEKKYLKKGQYPYNDIYYDIFLSGNGKHYFSFVNKEGKTILLNGNIKGFDSLEDAEKAINEVLIFAPTRKYYEKQRAKDGKFFFNLYNDKKEKIAKSFFFRKEEELLVSIDELVGNVSPGVKQENKNISVVAPISNIKQKTESGLSAEKEDLRRKAEAEERKRVAERERLALERKRKEEQVKAEKERKAAAIAMAEKNKKAGQKTSSAAIVQTKPKDPYSDSDLFDGCFKWFGILLLLGLLLFVISWYKGCFGNQNSSNDSADSTELVDGNIKDNTTGLDSLSSNDGQNNMTDSDATNNGSNKSDDMNSESANEGNSKGSDNLLGNCNCGEKAVVFEIPDSEPKPLSRLGTNPQFGNTHGLNSSDFLEELKYAASNNSWDKKYLDYLYKSMGYANGFADALSNQISQGKINPGTKGILGFGKYSGYGYSELNLTGKDLEVFHIKAANGCHINFMKTCGNFLFICE